MAKNIVVFSDGTGQEGGKGVNSNIYKLFNVIEDRTSKQISFYDRGLGTGWWRKVGALIGGAGISKNIKDCYRFIFENFEAGDQIYLFGFSRGAATVRSLSSFIHYFGILPQSRPELIDKAYAIYEIENEAERQEEADAFIELHHTMWTKIHFLGCFDTVTALGVPWKPVDVILNKFRFFHHKFHNFQLSEAVENAYHALAIDDEREHFQPVLFDPKILPGQEVEQVWFCGMHSDVGGGYEEDQLSNIPLAWMLDRAKKRGLIIYDDKKRGISKDVDGQTLFPGDVNGMMHNSREGWGKLDPKKKRSWRKSRSDKPIVHPSVWERTKNSNNEDNPPYQPWISKSDSEVWTESDEVGK